MPPLAGPGGLCHNPPVGVVHAASGGQTMIPGERLDNQAIRVLLRRPGRPAEAGFENIKQAHAA